MAAAATQTSICQISAQFFNLGHFSQCTQSSSGFELHIIDDKSTLKLKTGAMVQFF